MSSYCLTCLLAAGGDSRSRCLSHRNALSDYDPLNHSRESLTDNISTPLKVNAFLLLILKPNCCLTLDVNQFQAVRLLVLKCSLVSYGCSMADALILSI